MELSVILNVCEDAVCLEMALWGYFKQSYHHFEIVVADSGQGPDPSASLQRFQQETALSIRHLRQPYPDDRGSAVLNRAIEQAAGEYLVFTEDRCIPRWDFLEAHVRLARPRLFLSGGCLPLDRQLSRLIGREEVIAGHATDLNWLKNRGLVEHTGRGILSWWPRWDTAWGLCWPFRTAWNSVNASCWRDDLLEVNGFDERIQCGALDRELGERLYNAGVRGKNVRLRALCVRLASRVPSLPRQTLERNLALSGQTRRTRAVWTPFGIRKGFRVLGVEKETSPATKSEPRRRAVA